MKATLRKMGNSQGVLIPKAIVDLLGIEDDLDLVVENGAIVLRIPTKVVDPDSLEATDADGYRAGYQAGIEAAKAAIAGL